SPDWRFDRDGHTADQLLVGATEHVSVLAGGRFPADRIMAIPVDASGLIKTDAFVQMLEDLATTATRPMVSIMLANNETGVVQPVAELAALAHQAGAIVHTDAVQAAGRMPVDIDALGVDVLTLSGHKLGGPQGAGAIVRTSSAPAFPPLLTGGGQESRLRAGTENTAAVAGFGAAAAASAGDLELTGTWTSWRDELAARMSEDGPSATVFGVDAPRLPQTLCVGIAGVSAETLVMALDLEGVAVSSGSACSSGKVAPSHVLAAMNVPPEIARSAIRLSLGWESTKNDLDLFASRWRRVLSHISPGHKKAVSAA
ncbi:MAG: aminotransferase class V-fold PLP-dependent enzyme, partial [Hyphomicrobiales bacterium]|nr:aminotransferase class V-fold PLP-dependent enzyme [Hyphomicrobiales bacterium]